MTEGECTSKKRTLKVITAPVKQKGLTETSIKLINPGQKIAKYSDGKGLYLLVHPNGSKYWRYRYSFSGKEKLLSVGVYPEVSLNEARIKRDDLKKRIKSGFNPSTDRLVEKSKVKARDQAVRAATKTFIDQVKKMAEKIAIKIVEDAEKKWLK